MGNKKTSKKTFNAAFNKMPPKTVSVNVAEKNTKKIVTIFVAAFLAVVLLLGIILGTVAIVRNSSYLVKLEGVGINEGVANYLVSEFKAEYIKMLNSNGVNASDTAAFWNSPYINAEVSKSTHGDYLKLYVENSVKTLLASNLIFDKYTTLTSADKNTIAITVDEILTYRAGGSKSQFNEDTEKYGFDYSDFKKGIEMMYKASVVLKRVFGESGENVRSFTDFCKEFYMGSANYEGYTRVKIVFVRTEDTFVIGEDGKRVPDDKGNDSVRDLTSEEKAERAAYIEILDSCIEGFKNGTVAPETFDDTAEKIYAYKENLTEDYLDYYLHDSSSFTLEFNKKFPEVIEKAFTLGVGEVGMVEYGSAMADDENTGSFTGRVYVYRVANDEGAYERTDSVGFFSDFNTLCASALYSKMASEYSEQAELLDKWSEIDIIAHKYTSNYGV